MVTKKALSKQITSITAALLLTGALAAQEPTDLFSPVEAGKGPAAAQATTTEPEVLRTRLVTLDLGQLTPHSESVGEIVRFNLFDDVNAELELARATRPSLGGLHWFGRQAGEAVERAVLSIVDGRTSGSLTVGSRFFRIEHIAGPIHRIEELSTEREAFGADAVVPPGSAVTQPLAKQLLEQPPTAEMGSSHVIDILICYTPAGKARAGGKTQIEDRASLAVAEANSALQNSGVTGVQWNLVGAVEVSAAVPGDNNAPSEAANVAYLNYLTYDMDHVHDLRAQYGADIVSLWINNASSGTIGIGWIMPNLVIQYSWYDFAPFGFNVVETHFARGPQYTFAHEVGHNVGSAHNRASAQNAGTFDFSYGFQQPGEFYTLMSYSAGCGGCTPVNAWSNPNVSINGKPTGASGVNSADNARSMRETASIVADFRDSVGSPPPPPPPPNGLPTANPQSVTTPFGTPKGITLSGSDPDGDSLSYSIVASPSKGSLTGSGKNRTYTPNSGYSGSDSFRFRVSDGNGGADDATISITVQAPAPPPAVLVSEVVVVNGVSDENWTNVSLTNNYQSPVVVCTPAYQRTAQPSVARVRNASGSRFEVRLSSPGAAGVNAPVHCLIVSEGVYTFSQNGIKLEAVRYNSTATDHDTYWVGQARSYQNSYSNPVVIGQVMSYNDARFSSFWARGASSLAPPSASTLRLGKHVGEDSQTSRSTETIGYIVVEAGAGSIGSIGYEAGIGADIVQGVTDAPPYTYNLSSIGDVQAVVGSMAGMDGVNGGWPIIYGSNGASGSKVRFAIDEDVIGDPERAHTTEQVAYIAFGSATPVGDENDPPIANNQSVSTAFQTVKNIILTGSDPDGDPLGFQITSSPSHGSLSGAAPSVVYTPNSGYSGLDGFSFQVSDGRGGTASATVSITVQSGGGGNSPPTATPLSVTTTYEKSTWFHLKGTDPDGDPLTYRIIDAPDHGGTSGTLPHVVFWPDQGYSGPDSLTFEVSDGRGGTDTAVISIVIEPEDGQSVHIERFTTPASDSWRKINFAQPFTSPVVVCSAQYGDTNRSTLIRLMNLNSNSVLIRSQTVGTGVYHTVTAHCLAVEEGVYTQAEHGIKMEAVRFQSNRSDRSQSWQGHSRSYQQNYSNPVVVGQVMSNLSFRYSTFWAAGSKATTAPSSGALRVGRHTGEDPVAGRPNETIGYIVIESGSGSASGFNYSAGVGGASVRGLDDSPPYTYGVSNAALNKAVVSPAGMIGTDGGFPVLLDPGVSNGVMRLGFAEDELGDSDRFHAAERVAFIAFQ